VHLSGTLTVLGGLVLLTTLEIRHFLYSKTVGVP
jgi:hypothetical protein